MWKKKNVPDERIEKESNKLMAKMYYLMTILTTVSVVAKLVCNVPIWVYALELVSLVASIVYIVINELRKRILFVKDKDEDLLTIHRAVLSKAYMISFWVILFGEVVFLFVAGDYFWWLCAYLAIAMVPALIYTIASIKNGWLIWGSKKRETEGKKNFKVRVVIGSLAYGIFMGFPMLIKGGKFDPMGILWILGMAAMFGIPFYFAMMLMIKVAEKKADKNLEEKENAVEE